MTNVVGLIGLGIKLKGQIPNQRLDDLTMTGPTASTTDGQPSDSEIFEPCNWGEAIGTPQRYGPPQDPPPPIHTVHLHTHSF